MPYCRECGSFLGEDYHYCEQCGTLRKNPPAFTQSVGKTCPYCQFPIKQDSEVFQCPACKVPHHLECWEENGRCTTFGCTGIVDNAQFIRNDPSGFGRSPDRISIESGSLGAYTREQINTDVSHFSEQLVSYPRASYAKRFMAFIIDMVIFSLPFIFIILYWI